MHWIIYQPFVLQSKNAGKHWPAHSPRNTRPWSNSAFVPRHQTRLLRPKRIPRDTDRVRGEIHPSRVLELHCSPWIGRRWPPSCLPGSCRSCQDRTRSGTRRSVVALAIRAHRIPGIHPATPVVCQPLDADVRSTTGGPARLGQNARCQCGWSHRWRSHEGIAQAYGESVRRFRPDRGHPVCLCPTCQTRVGAGRWDINI
ncbi:hypothetical protein BS47DRAFT_754108 [Hydnum rufescens UP504]|uniref:Uncharacterized protein n=1 Tax=Hydnum rufescens UP504 TaxID=1448309 RepID=A0A9P6E2J1_9AGAM|nr:hypothetical protein BS47DRAFT_754108 [Hydnum rufescens UP504]